MDARGRTVPPSIPVVSTRNRVAPGAARRCLNAAVVLGRFLRAPPSVGRLGHREEHAAFPTHPRSDSEAGRQAGDHLVGGARPRHLAGTLQEAQALRADARLGHQARYEDPPAR